MSNYYNDEFLGFGTTAPSNIVSEWSRFNAFKPIMKIKGITEKELKALFQKAYITFCLRPSIFFKWIRNKQFTFIKSTAKAVTNHLKGR